jgi:CAAX protease family protein
MENFDPVPSTIEVAPRADVQAPARRHIAPLWHTVLLVFLLVGFSVLGAKSTAHLTGREPRIPMYIATMIWEWLLLGYVWVGLRLQHVPLREVIGDRWASAVDFVRDIAIAIGFMIVALMVLGAVGKILGLTGTAQASEAKRIFGFLVPRTRTEVCLWIGVSATAGFCEEVIFRGYLQQQFKLLFRSTAIGVVISAVLFGLSHGYEGGKRMILIAVYGVLFGLLALWRKSLRPGMFAHGLYDSLSGALMRKLS